MGNLFKLSAAALILGTPTSAAFAVPIPSGSYYTDVIGGGLGTALQPSLWARNDDGSFPHALGGTPWTISALITPPFSSTTTATSRSEAQCLATRPTR